MDEDLLLERQRDVQLNNYLAQENPFKACDWCGGNLLDSDWYYDFDGDCVCEGCVEKMRKSTERLL